MNSRFQRKLDCQQQSISTIIKMIIINEPHRMKEVLSKLSKEENIFTDE